MPSFSLISDLATFKAKALQYAVAHSECVCALEGNNQEVFHGAFPCVIAFGVKRLIVLESEKDSFLKLAEFQSTSNSIYGFLTYDLKNDIEDLSSNNIDHLNLPKLAFFEPLHTIRFHENSVDIEGENASSIFDQINDFKIIETEINAVKIQSRLSKQNYLDKIDTIQNHILQGDIYEMNFCQEYFVGDISLDPAALFLKLNAISPMPFSAFIKVKDKYLMCASPERFLKKEGQAIISQPIKGTVKRGSTFDEDEILKSNLLHSEKERAENIMIVDLVRNDLSKTAKDGSVKVEELCGIYSFSNVHQMISTVTSEIDEKYSIIEVLKQAFPMGSMTGAPKISAMQLIEKLELTKRGLFSGAVGYISANQDFDFNVVIRSILYNASNRYLSFQVGSAITIDADAEQEWQECETKILAIKKALGIV